jgi:tetratricopeptide (TPR) repeat protein
MPTRPKLPPPPPPPAKRPGRAAPKPAAGRGAATGDEAALRLAIGRDGVGLELARPARLGCITITELTATLPGIRFPVDVSGGVPRFRHRRGVLQTLQIEVGARALERWAAPRLRGLVGTRTPEVWIGVRPAGATVGVAALIDADDTASASLRVRPGGLERASAEPIVAFDVEVVAQQDDLVLIVRGARGTALPAPATAIAIACAEAILGGVAKREGAMFVIRSGAGAVARALLPEVGARVPAAVGLGWTSIAAHAETWILYAAREALTASPSELGLRAREVAAMLRDGDEALIGGDLARARMLYLEALERAPRHGEIARRILEIDAHLPGRAEAALATLAEVRHADGALHFGTTPGELLAEIGDLDAAVASLERAGDTEPTPALAARGLEIAALITDDAEEAVRWLDRAVARAPRSTTARWLRITRRLELGRLEDALADVEHLEALARGDRAKHAVWLRAGRAWQFAELGARAAVLFERALRCAPDEPQALAGLGAALVSEGREARGVAVLTHAIALAEAGDRTVPTAPMLLDLARALAERLDDLPAGIARASSIPADAPEAPVARGLEGRWRARLGDLAGASLAFARLRELATSMAASASDPRAPVIVALLVEGADLQSSRLHDPRGAQRHLAAALRLRPQDVELRRAYRAMGALVIRNDPTRPGTDHAAPEAEDPPPAPHGTERPFSLELGLAPERSGTEDEARAGARVEQLTRQLQADPRDDAAADELASLLELLGRGHELLALLSARLEDATPEQRVVLAPRARAALARLAVEAEEAGRLEEAALYRGTMASLPG